MVRNGYYSAI